MGIRISSSDGAFVRFDTTEDYERYATELKTLKVKYYGEDRARNGIWASNQNQYVAEYADLNQFDNKIMEDLWQQYNKEGLA